MNVSESSKKQFKSNIIAFMVIFGIFYGYVFLTNSGTKCYIKKMTGIPCPTCGMTRSYLHLFRGEFHEAFYDHPLFIAVPFIIIAVLLSYFFYKNVKIRKATNIFLIAMVVLFVGVYIYRMTQYFPHTDPLKFYEQGVVPRLYRFGNQIFFKP